MTAAQITSVLATRKTVRIAYSRATMIYSVDVVLGDAVLDHLTLTTNEDLAEGYARSASHLLGLDVTRLDTP